METLDAIYSRRSVREYTPQAVPDVLVQKLLAAAMQAPSAGNQQPWHFILVAERNQLNALANVLPYGKMLNTAPLGIAVCADLELEKYPGYWVQDCSASTQNLLLAAHDQGLGAVWLGVHPVEERVTGVMKVLALPAQVMPLCIIAFGYPIVKPGTPVRRYDETRLHYNRW
jgi:nitroreductase